MPLGMCFFLCSVVCFVFVHSLQFIFQWIFISKSIAAGALTGLSIENCFIERFCCDFFYGYSHAFLCFAFFFIHFSFCIDNFCFIRLITRPLDFTVVGALVAAIACKYVYFSKEYK